VRLGAVQNVEEFVRQHASERPTVQDVALPGGSRAPDRSECSAHPVAFHFTEWSDAPVDAVRESERRAVFRSRWSKRREFTLAFEFDYGEFGEGFTRKKTIYGAPIDTHAGGREQSLGFGLQLGHRPRRVYGLEIENHRQIGSGQRRKNAQNCA